MSSERVKKELYETAMTGEKALTSLMYVQMTLYAAKSQRTYAKVRGEGRAMMRHTGIHMNQYLRAAGNDLESFRIRLKETHLPDELQPKAGAFLVQTVHTFDTDLQIMRNPSFSDTFPPTAGWQVDFFPAKC